MATRKPKVIVTRKLPDAVETRLRELFDTELNIEDRPMGPEDLIDAVGRAEVLVSTITSTRPPNSSIMAGPAPLKGICTISRPIF